MYNPFSLAGKKILITGASSGIGRATAIECSKLDAQLIITGRNKERLNETFQSLKVGEHSQITGDLCDMHFVKELVNEIANIDGIVHSAGITFHLPFKFTSEEKLNQIFNINFNAPALLTQELLQVKKINKKGSIVFISSISGVTTSVNGLSLYSATKGAINGLVKGLALELSNQKIRVNTIIPALIETNILQEGIITQEHLLEDVKSYPLGRHGKPEEVAFAIVYLLSDASSWTTGSNILIDGGLTLR